MASKKGYKITAGSLKEENGYLRCMVTFYDDAAVASSEQLYEVKGLSQETLDAALTAASRGYAAMNAPVPVDPDAEPIKNITVGKKVTI